MKVIVAREEFTDLTEDEVLLALQDTDPANPIAQEVARLIDGYIENFQEHAARLGRIPDAILRARPGCAVEAVAMRLTTETIRQTLAEHVD